ncbi:MAG: hypothetical protein ABSF26_29830 [Thermoguttaceae bacterium]|jgi:hypothetical protein
MARFAGRTRGIHYVGGGCYPQAIIRDGLQDAWKQARVAFEVRGVMQNWKDAGFAIDYTIDQSLKWQILSLNAKWTYHRQSGRQASTVSACTCGLAMMVLRAG